MGCTEEFHKLNHFIITGFGGASLENVFTTDTDRHRAASILKHILNIRGFLEVKFCHFASLLICLWVWVALELPPALLQTRVTNVLTRVTG